MTRRRLHLGAKPAGLALLAATAILVSACGGSSPSRTTAATAGYHVVPLRHVNERKAKERREAAARERPKSAVRIHRPAAGTGSGEINDDNPGHADTGHLSTIASRPCALVSVSQAQTIVGGPVSRPVTAPLGPTCIYHSMRDNRVITMTVEAADLTRIKGFLEGIKSAHMAGHVAYCGTYGQPTTVVSIGKGRVLDVTAPCSLGFRFAANALPRLTS
jgi:hypothetical protein